MREAYATVLTLAWALAISGCGGGGHAAPDARPPGEGGADSSLSIDGDAGDGNAGDGDVGDAVEASDVPDASAIGEMSDVLGSGDSGEAGDDNGDALDSGPPSVSQNPPVPTGWKLVLQSEVTPEMTDWAVAILHDPVTYPMFSTAMKTFGALTVLARVEWLPPDFQNNVVHRGVVLYVPI